MKNTVFINEDLTLENVKLAYEARKLKKQNLLADTFTRDGRIYVKHYINQRPKVIRNVDHLLSVAHAPSYQQMSTGVNPAGSEVVGSATTKGSNREVGGRATTMNPGTEFRHPAREWKTLSTPKLHQQTRPRPVDTMAVVPIRRHPHLKPARQTRTTATLMQPPCRLPSFHKMNNISWQTFPSLKWTMQPPSACLIHQRTRWRPTHWMNLKPINRYVPHVVNFDETMLLYWFVSQFIWILIWDLSKPYISIKDFISRNILRLLYKFHQQLYIALHTLIFQRNWKITKLVM